MQYAIAYKIVLCNYVRLSTVYYYTAKNKGQAQLLKNYRKQPIKLQSLTKNNYFLLQLATEAVKFPSARYPCCLPATPAVCRLPLAMCFWQKMRSPHHPPPFPPFPLPLGGIKACNQAVDPQSLVGSARGRISHHLQASLPSEKMTTVKIIVSGFT